MTRDLIVKTALKLFLQKGFYNVSMNMVAAEVGISKPAIYHHFGSKDAMVEGVLDYFTERMKIWSKEYYSNLDSGIDFIERMFKAISIYKDVETVLLDETAESYPYSYNDLLMILSKYKPAFRNRIAQDLKKVHNVLTQQIAEAQTAGLIRSDIQPSAVATMIHTIVEGAAFICEIDSDLAVEKVSEETLILMQKFLEKRS